MDAAATDTRLPTPCRRDTHPPPRDGHPIEHSQGPSSLVSNLALGEQTSRDPTNMVSLQQQTSDISTPRTESTVDQPASTMAPAKPAQRGCREVVDLMLPSSEDDLVVSQPSQAPATCVPHSSQRRVLDQEEAISRRSNPVTEAPQHSIQPTNTNLANGPHAIYSTNTIPGAPLRDHAVQSLTFGQSQTSKPTKSLTNQDFLNYGVLASTLANTSSLVTTQPLNRGPSTSRLGPLTPSPSTTQHYSQRQTSNTFPPAFGGLAPQLVGLTRPPHTSRQPAQQALSQGQYSGQVIGFGEANSLHKPHFWPGGQFPKAQAPWKPSHSENKASNTANNTLSGRLAIESTKSALSSSSTSVCSAHYQGQASISPSFPAASPLVKSISETTQTRSTYKSSYDPETIVHNLQLTLNCHPNRPGLNHKLEPLRKLSQVRADADLSTFRFDLAFPNGIPTGGLVEAVANMVSSIPPSDSYRHSPASSHYTHLPPIDPTPKRPSMLRHASTPASLIASPVISVIVPSPPKSAQKEYIVIGTSPSVEDTASTTRRGRPPNSSSNTSISLIQTSRTPTPSASVSDDPLASTSTTIPKKRARPFRNSDAISKPATHDPDVEVRPRKRGRPFKYDNLLTVPRQKVEYYPFMCEWKDCQAELINLDFLRRHVTGLHGLAEPRNGKRNDEIGRMKTAFKDGVWVCRWAKCGKLLAVENEHGGDGKETRHSVDGRRFGTRKEWEEHVEEAHMIPMAWHMGDGPKVTFGPSKPLTPREAEPWLYDRTGKQVTPSVKNQIVRGGRAKDYYLKEILGRGALNSDSDSGRTGNSGRSSSLMVLVQSPSRREREGFVEVDMAGSDGGEGTYVD